MLPHLLFVFPSLFPGLGFIGSPALVLAALCVLDRPGARWFRSWITGADLVEVVR